MWLRDRVQTVSVILSRIGLLKIYPPPPLLLSRQIWKMFRNHPTIWNPSIFTDMRCWHVCTYMYLADQIFWSSLERGPFKGTGGGSHFKNLFFFVLVYLIALNMGSQELFTELKKLALLLSYDLSKLGPTRRFLGFCIGKSWIFVIENYLFFLSTFCVLMLETQFFGYG